MRKFNVLSGFSPDLVADWPKMKFDHKYKAKAIKNHIIMNIKPKCFESHCRYFLGIIKSDNTTLSEYVVCRKYHNQIPNVIAYGIEKCEYFLVHKPAPERTDLETKIPRNV